MSRFSSVMLLLASALFGIGCHSSNPLIHELEPSALAQLQATGKAVFFDVNVEDFRKNNGVVPGAELLASSSSYELTRLPADKAAAIVFYCSNRL